MPFFFILFGVVLIVVGYRNVQDDFFTLVKGEFSGPKNFLVFALALFVVGLFGYIPKFKGLSNAFMFLIIIVILLSNRGFFDQFIQTVKTTEVPSTTTPKT